MSSSSVNPYLRIHGYFRPLYIRSVSELLRAPLSIKTRREGEKSRGGVKDTGNRRVLDVGGTGGSLRLKYRVWERY